jgi:hypothetical protein
MEAKEVRELMEAYASVYEGKKSDCVDKEDKGAHNCAKKVCHEQFGEGTCIFGQHSVPDENGFVSHYDVIFEHGIEKNVPVSEMEVLISESHMKEGHRYEGEQIEEDLQGTVKKGLDAAANFMKTNPVGKAVSAALAPAGPGRGTVTQAQQMQKVKSNVKEEDLFDLIKGHLISEGYADTEEAALKIMANMSETWKQSIVEAKVDKQLPEHERSGARLNRYDNPSGALALGGGQQRTRRQEHKERRGKKK